MLCKKCKTEEGTQRVAIGESLMWLCEGCKPKQKPVEHIPMNALTLSVGFKLLGKRGDLKVAPLKIP